MGSKVDNLCEKWHEKSPPRARVPDMIEYVKISDHALETRFGPVQKEAPVVYGGVGITEVEAAAASLGPKFCVIPRLSMEDVQVATEEVLAKIRWEDMSRDERDGEQWTPEYQIEKNLFHTVYDEENGVLDFRKKRVTDLETNRRIIIPEPSENIVNNTPIEVGMANMKTRIDNFVQTTIKQKCNPKGYPRKSNLSSTEAEGLKSLRERDDIFMTMTDKTKKLCINTKENYINRMGTHLTGNEEIDWARKQGDERIINAHAAQMIRAFRIGENHRYRGRVKMATLTCPGACTLTVGWRTLGRHTPGVGQTTRGPAFCVTNGIAVRLALTPTRELTLMRSRSGAAWRPTPWPGTSRRSTRPGGGTRPPSASGWRRRGSGLCRDRSGRRRKSQTRPRGD